MYAVLVYVFLSHRGATFRAAYSRLGEIRSLIPSAVRIMALTATVTQETFRVITVAMGMTDPYLILASPEKANIKYIVVQRLSALNLAQRLAKGILAKGAKYPKIIIFLQKVHTYMIK